MGWGTIQSFIQEYVLSRCLVAILFWVLKTLTQTKQTHASYLELTHGWGETEIKQMSDGSGGGNARKTNRAGDGRGE